MALLKQNVLRDIAKAVETETKGCGRDKHRLACKVAQQVASRPKRTRSRSRSASRTKPPTTIPATQKKKRSRK